MPIQAYIRRRASEWRQQYLREKGAGTGCGERVREQGAGTGCGNRVRGKGAGKGCGKRVQEKGAGKGCGKRVREKGADTVATMMQTCAQDESETGLANAM